ncbi:MAG: putative phosphoserine phosphatase 2 [candidate division WS2 bacterium ADurb.Bin280]|uniref:Putative phosphoserine phosphatase 2 n=1 Tax=candidate division WS2 bacterium ADurb.Bin280 TaxID=1852829 RepID=A0A1V5SEA4_9BACT|nr:MAG: putative phosphoserine phosphatase 2 [candidate division WS2 bacterium ADurb.Bin280]
MDGKVYLIRHAKATHNRYDGKAIFAGGRVDSDLTSEGESEAREMGRLLKDKDIKVIVHSPLKRSKHTAQIIKSEISDKTDVEMVELKGIEEVDVGEFTDKTREEITKIYCKELEIFLQGDVEKWNFPGGESFSELKLRVARVIEALKKVARQGGVLIVGHGMFNRVILSIIAPSEESLWKPTSYPHDKIVEISKFL